MVYVVLLELHSWCRWAVLLAALTVLGRSWGGLWTGRAWSVTDGRLVRMWVGATDTQLLLGLSLYLVGSPLAAMARQDVHAAWHEPTLRFFGFLHPLMMVLAVVATHATSIWTRRAASDEARFWRLVRGLLGTALLVSLATPWPFLAHGRPLFRL